jgi:uncharacterized protein (TIGR03437 family)
MVSNLKVKSAAILFLSFSSLLSAAPRLSLSATTVGPIIIPTGTNGPAQVIQASNTGDGSLNLTATSSASWLSATVGARGSCSANGGNCYSVTIALNTSSLAAGVYKEFVTIADPTAVDSPQDIAVTVNTSGVPSSITAYVTPSGGGGSTALIDVFTTGTGVHGTVTTASGGNWLSFLSGSGGIIQAPAPWLIQVAAQNGQNPGTYSGTVVISGSTAPSDNKTVNVTMNVTSSPIVSTANISTIRLMAAQGGATQFMFQALSNIGQGTLTISSATGSAKFLTATVQGTSLLIAADPTGLTPGIYNGTVTINSNAANNSAVSIPVELVVGAAGVPQIFTGGIVNISTYAQEPVPLGGIAAIFGSQLAPAGTFATLTAVPLPTTLGGTQVLVNGVPAPLFFVSPGQINFQIPYSLNTGGVNTVQVVAGSSAGNLRSVTVDAAAPRLLTRNGAYGAIVNAADNSLTLPSTVTDAVFQTHPAKAGDTIVIYGVGFGQTTPPATAGQASSSGGPGNPLQTLPNVAVSFGGSFGFGGVAVTSSFVGLTPTTAGLYQINVVVPANVTGPSVPLSIVSGGVQSNVVNLAISANGK